jgi:type I restriction enzyme S subunit
MSEVKLPEGWLLTSLEHTVDILDSMRVPVNNAERLSRIENKNSDELFPYYGATGEVGKIDSYIFDEELVALGEDGVPFLDSTKRKAYMLKGKTWVNNHAHVLKAIDGYSINTFIYYFLNQFNYQDYVNGGTRLKLTQANMRKIPICLPPLTEQKIIADKLDTLLAQVDSTKVRLEQIPQILKRFRQAVLAAAVSGKLTEEWREQNKISSDWKSVQFLELITKLRSGSGDTPSDNVCGIPILRSSAIRPQIINYEDVRYLSSEETLNEDNYLKNGDLLFTRLSGSAEYVGNCALVKGLTKKYQYPDRLFCARLKDQRNANYLEYFCSSNIFREHIIKSIKSSAGHQRITLDAIRTAQIFIPDYLEQTEIVRRVEQLYAYADGIEKQVQNALERVNNLTQSILAKAFRGELTAQWRAENPDLISGENSAQALLAKIQQQRSNTKTIKRSKGNS